MPSASRVSTAALAAALLFGILALAEQLPIRSYSVADGLAGNVVTAVLTDSRGFLWIATNEGLSRFDGYDFTNYDRADGLPRDSVSNFLETRSGMRWAVTTAGVAKLNPDASPGPRFTSYRPDIAAGLKVYTFFEDRSGRLWCGTEDGLFLLRPSDAAGKDWWFERVPLVLQSGQPASDRRVLSLYEDRQGNLWIGAIRALYRRAPNGALFEYALDAPAGEWNTVVEDSSGRLWGGRFDGIWRIACNPDGEYRVEPGFVPKPKIRVWSILARPGGGIWAATSGGFVEWDPDRRGNGSGPHIFTESNGLSRKEITSLATDREGNLWLGSNGGGLNRLARKGFISYGSADRLSSSEYPTLFRDRAGDVIVAFHDHLNVLHGRSFTRVRPAFPRLIRYFGWGWHQNELQDSAGEWWISTGEGLARFPAVPIEALALTKPKAVYTTRDGLRTNEIFRLFEDSREGIWIACIGPEGVNGLSRWDRDSGQFQHFDAHTTTVASAFAEAADGTIWIGYYDGVLGRYRAGAFSFFGEADGLAGGMVQALHYDRAGRLWIATGRGLTRLDSPSSQVPRFTRFGTGDGLSSNIIRCITEDRWGCIYLATGRAVDRIEHGTVAPGSIRHYTQADGIARGNLRDIAFDGHGVLWCASEQGVSTLRPGEDPPRRPPPVYIRQVRIRGEPYPLSERALSSGAATLTLAPDQNQVQIDFSAPSFAAGEVLYYQYTLEKADHDWSKPTTQRTVNYSNLPAGRYRFLVRVITPDQQVSDQPAALEIAIRSRLWRRLWFQVLLLGVSLSGVLLVLRSRAQWRLELERMRTRIATDLHDDIGSGLSQIAVLTEVARTKTDVFNQGLQDPLSRAASVSRELAASMSDIVWSVNPNRDQFRDLTQRMRRFSSDLLSGAAIDFQFRVTGSSEIPLPPNVRREVYLIFKEALNNVLRHSGCASVEIAIGIAAAALELRIADDGIGIPSDLQDSGNGMATMRERARRIGGLLEVRPANERGLEVRLRVPLRSSKFRALLHGLN
jgi:ligand-binding sensor domain-containing protein/signal transduction histidine kinase